MRSLRLGPRQNRNRFTNSTLTGPPASHDESSPDMSIGSEILFVRNDGLFAVANIAGGKLNLTQSGNNAAPNWTHVLASSEPSISQLHAAAAVATV